MPKAYGIDLRKKILESYLCKEGSLNELASRYKVSISTIKRISQRYRNTGDVQLYLHNVGRHELINDDGKEALIKILEESPDLTLKEIQEKFAALYGISPVIAVFHRVLKNLNFKHKKKSNYASQRDREDVKKKEKNLLRCLKAIT
jgi:transposase